VTLSILHAPINIAGAPGQLSAGLREAGARSDLLVWRDHPFAYGADVVLDIPTGGYAQLPRRVALQAAALVRHARRYDVVHVHGKDSFLPRHADLPLLRRLGKGVAVSFWGSDIRDRPARELRWLRHVQLACVGSYLTYGRAPRGAWRDYVVLPTPFDVRGWTPALREPGRVLRLVHAPSNRAVKGTDAILAAVDELRRRGAPVELTLVEGVSHAEARRIYEDADLVLDQLLMGWHGIFAIECMALGKPVVCYLDPDARARTAERFGLACPLVSATPETVVDALAELVAEPERLPELGRAGRAYVERVHDRREVGLRLLDAYAAAGIGQA
jgi:hypothetical protein